MWSIAERRFRNNWSLRMRLFDVMVRGIITYEAEQWGWKEEREMERTQMKYIRWTLKLNRNTPWHAISVDTKRKRLRQEYTRRALKFDRKMAKAEEDSWERICWKRIKEREEEEWRKGERGKDGNGKREMLESIGLSIKEWNNCLDRKEDNI